MPNHPMPSAAERYLAAIKASSSSGTAPSTSISTSGASSDSKGNGAMANGGGIGIAGKSTSLQPPRISACRDRDGDALLVSPAVVSPKSESAPPLLLPVRLDLHAHLDLDLDVPGETTEERRPAQSRPTSASSSRSSTPATQSTPSGPSKMSQAARSAEREGERDDDSSGERLHPQESTDEPERNDTTGSSRSINRRPTCTSTSSQSRSTRTSTSSPVKNWREKFGAGARMAVVCGSAGDAVPAAAAAAVPVPVPPSQRQPQPSPSSLLREKEIWRRRRKLREEKAAQARVEQAQIQPPERSLSCSGKDQKTEASSTASVPSTDVITNRTSDFRRNLWLRSHERESSGPADFVANPQEEETDTESSDSDYAADDEVQRTAQPLHLQVAGRVVKGKHTFSPDPGRVTPITTEVGGLIHADDGGTQREGEELKACGEGEDSGARGHTQPSCCAQGNAQRLSELKIAVSDNTGKPPTGKRSAGTSRSQACASAEKSACKKKLGPEGGTTLDFPKIRSSTAAARSNTNLTAETSSYKRTLFDESSNEGTASAMPVPDERRQADDVAEPLPPAFPAVALKADVSLTSSTDVELGVIGGRYRPTRGGVDASEELTGKSFKINRASRNTGSRKVETSVPHPFKCNSLQQPLQDTDEQAEKVTAFASHCRRGIAECSGTVEGTDKNNASGRGCREASRPSWAHVKLRKTARGSQFERREEESSPSPRHDVDEFSQVERGETQDMSADESGHIQGRIDPKHVLTNTNTNTNMKDSFLTDRPFNPSKATVSGSNIPITLRVRSTTSSPHAVYSINPGTPYRNGRARIAPPAGQGSAASELEGRRLDVAKPSIGDQELLPKVSSRTLSVSRSSSSFEIWPRHHNASQIGVCHDVPDDNSGSNQKTGKAKPTCYMFSEDVSGATVYGEKCLGREEKKLSPDSILTNKDGIGAFSHRKNGNALGNNGRSIREKKGCLSGSNYNDIKCQQNPETKINFLEVQKKIREGKDLVSTPSPTKERFPSLARARNMHRPNEMMIVSDRPTPRQDQRMPVLSSNSMEEQGDGGDIISANESNRADRFGGSFDPMVNRVCADKATGVIKLRSKFEGIRRDDKVVKPIDDGRIECIRSKFEMLATHHVSGRESVLGSDDLNDNDMSVKRMRQNFEKISPRNRAPNQVQLLDTMVEACDNVNNDCDSKKTHLNKSVSSMRSIFEPVPNRFSLKKVVGSASRPPSLIPDENLSENEEDIDDMALIMQVKKIRNMFEMGPENEGTQVDQVRSSSFQSSEIEEDPGAIGEPSLISSKKMMTPPLVSPNTRDLASPTKMRSPIIVRSAASRPRSLLMPRDSVSTHGEEFESRKSCSQKSGQRHDGHLQSPAKILRHNSALPSLLLQDALQQSHGHIVFQAQEAASISSHMSSLELTQSRLHHNRSRDDLGEEDGVTLSPCSSNVSGLTNPSCADNLSKNNDSPNSNATSDSCQSSAAGPLIHADLGRSKRSNRYLKEELETSEEHVFPSMFENSPEKGNAAHANEPPNKHGIMNGKSVCTPSDGLELSSKQKNANGARCFFPGFKEAKESIAQNDLVDGADSYLEFDDFALFQFTGKAENANVATSERAEASSSPIATSKGGVSLSTVSKSLHDDGTTTSSMHRKSGVHTSFQEAQRDKKMMLPETTNERTTSAMQRLLELKEARRTRSLALARSANSPSSKLKNTQSWSARPPKATQDIELQQPAQDFHKGYVCTKGQAQRTGSKGRMSWWYWQKRGRRNSIRTLALER